MAGKLAMLPYFIAVILLPFLGIFLDKYGKRSLTVTLAFCILISAFIISSLTENEIIETISLILVGVSYTLFGGSFYSCV